jgi:hypothetical protein
MFDSHQHLGLTDYEFDVPAHEIRKTFYQLGVPSQDIGEFMDIIENYRGKCSHGPDTLTNSNPIPRRILDPSRPGLLARDS